jgi:4-hydroxy-4-methyl-2-oxoglutarate aldolase
MHNDISQPPMNFSIEEAATFSTATLHEAADKVGALPSAIKPINPQWEICGLAFPVLVAPGDNLWLHHAIYMAQPGDILVVSTCGHYEAGYWGEIMTRAALLKRIGGVVIDGCCRDIMALRSLGLPIFSRGACIRGTSKGGGRGGVKIPIQIADAPIEPGDLTRGDEDGVVVIPKAIVPSVLKKARDKVAMEAQALQEISDGRTTLEVFGWRPQP